MEEAAGSNPVILTMETEKKRNPKMSIVVRADLGMRKGKMIVQGAHAAMAFLVQRFSRTDLTFTAAELDWLEGRFTKVCVRADSEAELLGIYEKALAAELTVHLITDAGLTEFKGVPTKTCLAIGPDWPEKIDEITGHLKLL